MEGAVHGSGLTGDAGRVPWPARGILIMTHRVAGAPVAAERHDGVISFHPSTPRSMIAVTGGTDRMTATKAVLASGMLAGLITDEPPARRLVAKTV